MQTKLKNISYFKIKNIKMNRPELYQKTVDLLLDAYNNNDLEHGDCSACAVGNICKGNTGWTFYFYTPKNGKQTKAAAIFADDFRDKEDFEKIFPTIGYTLEELAKIENVFEKSIKKDRVRLTGCDKKLGQMIGLKAVFKLLKKIHSAEPQIEEVSKIRLEKVYGEKVVQI